MLGVAASYLTLYRRRYAPLPRSLIAWPTEWLTEERPEELRPVLVAMEVVPGVHRPGTSATQRKKRVSEEGVFGFGRLRGTRVSQTSPNVGKPCFLLSKSTTFPSPQSQENTCRNSAPSGPTLPPRALQTVVAPGESTKPSLGRALPGRRALALGARPGPDPLQELGDLKSVGTWLLACVRFSLITSVIRI